MQAPAVLSHTVSALPLPSSRPELGDTHRSPIALSSHAVTGRSPEGMLSTWPALIGAAPTPFGRSVGLTRSLLLWLLGGALLAHCIANEAIEDLK